MSKNISGYVKSLSISKPESMEYYVSVTSPKDRHKFISRVEKICRSSQEYRDLMQYYKENVGFDKCAFFQISCMENKRFKIEIHHEPFTLYDYVSVVLDKFIASGDPINDLLIADEVLEDHYSNVVGLIPLSKTVHQLVHNSTKVIVPVNMCYGNYSEFLEKYADYIPDELYDKLEKKLDQTASLTKDSFEALTKQFTYIDVDGFEEAKKIPIAEDNIA